MDCRSANVNRQRGNTPSFLSCARKGQPLYVFKVMFDLERLCTQRWCVTSWPMKYQETIQPFKTKGE